MTGRKLIGRLALAVGACVLLLAGAVLISAATDEPSAQAAASVAIDAPRRDVWRILLDVDAYGEWNPTIVSAQGTLATGNTLRLRVRNGDEAPKGRDVSVLDVKKGRKVRWQDRMLVPGVRDRELTIRLRSTGAGDTLVTAVERYEGLLVPFGGTGDERNGLKRMLAALEARTEGL